MRITLLLLLLIVLAGSCTSKKNDSTPAVTSAVDTLSFQPKLPFLTSEEVNKIYSLSEKVDMIFYNLPISVSQDDVASVKNTALYVVPAAPKVTRSCAALGRLAFLTNGKIFREADIYVGEGCNYLVFMENNQPVAANAMATEGIQFFNKITSQVNAMKK